MTTHYVKKEDIQTMSLEDSYCSDVSNQSMLQDDTTPDYSINSEAKRLKNEVNQHEVSQIDINNSTEQDQDYQPKKIRDLATLKKVNFKIKTGEFVCIIGDIGSGKSSILSALVGDLLYLEKDTYHVLKNKKIDEFLSAKVKQASHEKILRPPVQLREGLTISYAPQIPWLQNRTIRDNIVFGKPFDKEWYEVVIKKC